jgi:hypothetical protein
LSGAEAVVAEVFFQNADWLRLHADHYE